MKKLVIIVLFSILALVSCQEELNVGNDILSTPVTKSGDSDSAFGIDSSAVNKADTIKISKWDALKIVEPITSQYPDRWVDISDEIVSANSKVAYNALGHVIENGELSYFMSPDFDAWLVVIDFDPTFFGRQELLHIFVDVNDGSIVKQIIDGRAIVTWDTSRNEYEYRENFTTVESRDALSFSTRSASPIKWAVIIGGGSCPENNYSCFYNETKLVYNTLVETLDYSKGCIFCLMSDGNSNGLDQRAGASLYIDSDTDFDGDGSSDVFFEAKKSRISNVFNILRLWAYPGDEVLVFLAGHGDQDAGFCLWDYETISPSELDSELDKLNPSVKVDIVLGQCYSGAFVSSLSGTGRTVSTSCSAFETAGGLYYGLNASCYFLRNWTMSIPVYDDSNTNDAYVTPEELFYSATTALASTPGCSEQPQYDSTPIDFGKQHSLKGEVIPYIIGSEYLSTNINSVYSIVNYPQTSSTVWSVGSKANMIADMDSTIYVTGKIIDPLQFYSTGTPIQVILTVDGKNHKLIKEITGVWKPGYYVGGSHIWGSNGVYYVRYFGGEYGYAWYSDNPAWPVVGFTGAMANVLEGFTSDPVNLVASFYSPLGDSIYVMDRVK